MATDKKLSSLVINTLTQAQYDSATKNEDELYLTPDDTDEQLANKQDKLVSGTNIKTINGTSVLGSGNIEISGGSGDTSDCAKKSEDNTFSGTNTFSSPIKADEIDNSLGNSMLRYKSTESNTPVVAGTSEKPLVLMGSGTRPTYSASGSDFVGSDIALVSDVNNSSYGMHTFDLEVMENLKSMYTLRIICSTRSLQLIKNALMEQMTISTWDECKTTIETYWSSFDSSTRVSQLMTPLSYLLNYIGLPAYLKNSIEGGVFPCIILDELCGYVIYSSYPESYTSSEATGISWLNVTTTLVKYSTLSINIDD